MLFEVKDSLETHIIVETVYMIIKQIVVNLRHYTLLVFKFINVNQIIVIRSEA